MLLDLMTKLSIIIPTLNEEAIIGELLSIIHNLKEEVDFEMESIVVDGGSTDATVEICKRFDVKLLNETRGRGGQLAAGARNAAGETLLFVHADSQLRKEHLEKAANSVLSNGVVAGGFYLNFDDDHILLNFACWVNKLRFRVTRTFYGDHCLFLKRDVYQRAGGFSKIPLFEDVEFSQRLKKLGSVRLFEPPIKTSSRRFRSEGVATTYLKMALMHLFYWVGVSPSRLARWYWKKSR